ncbi:MAG TPA: hypothetical protein VL053_14170 [Arachidicoccus sp.]|nr:hypothetical protein [Arachidicoccus sp.]
MHHIYIEQFNRTYRENVPDTYFLNLADEFVKDYKQDWPHDALGGIPPVKYWKENSQKLIGGECSGGIAEAQRAPIKFRWRGKKSNLKR